MIRKLPLRWLREGTTLMVGEGATLVGEERATTSGTVEEGATTGMDYK
jgi:hypothetical protein